MMRGQPHTPETTATAGCAARQWQPQPLLDATFLSSGENLGGFLAEVGVSPCLNSERGHSSSLSLPNTHQGGQGTRVAG